MDTRTLALCFAALCLPFTACIPPVVDGGGGSSDEPTPRPDEDGDPSVCGDPELHVVGLYDPYTSASSARDDLRPARVHIDRPGPLVLFLSAYSATDWTVTVGPETRLLRVIAHGYEPQTVHAPPGVETSALSAEAGDAFLGCGYEFPDRDPISGCETPELLAGVAAYVGAQVSSFHGCYAASNFVIGADLSSSSDCATNMGYEHTSFVAGSCGEPPRPEGPCDDTTGVGRYEGFMRSEELYPGGGPFIVTEAISCQGALENCRLNAESNPGVDVLCTWNGEVIFRSDIAEGSR